MQLACWLRRGAAAAASGAWPHHAAAAQRRWLSDVQRVVADDGKHSQGPQQPRAGPKGSFLARHGRDLTREAAEGLLDPVIGREDVVHRCLQILLRRTKNNPVLIGDPGVGKTAVAEGIAQLLAGLGPESGLGVALPPGLLGRRLVSLDVGSLVAGTQYRGSLEERLQGVLREVRAAQGQVLLFIDELHLLVDAGRVEGGMDAANLLKPALARGELHCIGATTVEEYRKHVEADAAFARRFQAVTVEEPSPSEALACLRGLRHRYEAHHGVALADEALAAAVAAAQRYIPDRRLPDSAIDVLDQAAARARLLAAAEASSRAAAASSLASAASVAGSHDRASPALARAAPAGVAEGAAAAGAVRAAAAPSSWGQRPWSPRHSLERSAEEERELLEWFGATLAQRMVEDTGGDAAAVPPARGLGTGAGAGAVQGKALQPPGLARRLQAMADGRMLPCPHCGTPSAAQEGAITVLCGKCRAVFLNLPPQKLMLGASLFLNRPAGAPAKPGLAAGGSGSGAATAAGAGAAATSFGASAGRGPSQPGVGAHQAAHTPAGTAASAKQRQGEQQELRLVVGARDVLAVVAESAGVPLSHLSRSDWESMLTLEDSLRKQVAGQDAAVHAVASALRLGRLGLQRGRRPLASLVLSGPRGVGRSTLCKALATSLFASDRALLRFDMAELGADRTSVSRLVGAPPGYVGFGEGGLLTEAVRRRPHSVVVFENVDRAHPEVLSLLVQAVEQGQLRDSMGRPCDFRNCVVAFTTAASTASSSGSAEEHSSSASSRSSRDGSQGAGWDQPSPAATSVTVPVSEHDHLQLHQFTPGSAAAARHNGGASSHGPTAVAGYTGHSAAALSLAGDAATAAATGSGPSTGAVAGGPAAARPHSTGWRLPPELAGCVDLVVELEGLSPQAMRQVAAMQLQDAVQMLGEQGVELEVGEGVREWLAAVAGHSPEQGARPLQRLLRQHVLGPATQALLEHRMALAAEAQQGGGEPIAAGEEAPACRVAVGVTPGGGVLELQVFPPGGSR